MRKLIVLLLLLTGSVAVGHAFRNEIQHREDRVAVMTRILTSPGTPFHPAETVAPPSRAPSVEPQLLAPPSRIIATDLATGRVVETAPAARTVVANVAVSTPGEAISPAPAGESIALSAWTTRVTDEGPTTSPKAKSVPVDRYGLVRTIQRELKRVRCYGGPIDGSWGDRSRTAMQRFIERANASLPVVEPDTVLLTLLRAHDNVTCGSCPSGQTLVDGSRCVPNAILARTDKSRAAEATTVAAAEATASGVRVVTSALPRPPREPLPGRMAVGGPATGEPPQAPVTPQGGSVVAALEPDDGVAVDVETLPLDTVETMPDSGSLRQTPNAHFAPRAAVPPRVAAPRVAAPSRPARVVARPAQRPERTARRQPYGVRSVQSLFTHPLGRL